MKFLYYSSLILLMVNIGAAAFKQNVASKINFELINKSAIPISLNVQALGTIGDYYVINSRTNIVTENPVKIGGACIQLNPGDTFAAQISLGETTIVQIGRVVGTNKGKFPSTETEQYYINAQDKKRFLSYNISNAPGKRLYPQTGSMKGLGKITPNFIKEDRTNSGLLKRNNVIQEDIVLN